MICLEAAAIGLAGGVAGIVAGHLAGAAGSIFFQRTMGEEINWVSVSSGRYYTWVQCC